MSTKQPDLSEFFRLAKPRKPPCPIGYALSQLDDVEAAQLQAACATDGGIINAGAIVQWLKKRGHASSPQRVVNHRRGVCSCHDES